MNRKTFLCSMLLALTVARIASAQDAAPAAAKLSQLGIDDVTATKALVQACTASNQSGSLNRLVESLNEHLLVAFQTTRKFKIIAKSDLGNLMADQQVPVGVIRDPADNKSMPGRIKGLDYLMVATVTDFVDVKEGVFVESQGIRVDKRSVRASATIKIYDSSNGALLSAAAIPIALDEAAAGRVPRHGYNNRGTDDSLIESASIGLAQRAANRVVDVLYPARVLAITLDQVTINRGEGSGVEAGQVWEICALGGELVDPDTGASLGREEIKVGEVLITQVMPNFCKATVRGNNLGIDRGAIARPVLTASYQPSPAAATPQGR